ncbi:hypothetical protein E1298_34985 [Actinomadura rubrisoli]|uniref:RICIN domain-containing protein n=1 Tax=Actinomadura rubrisoli TaxID=2530368 RepID=A0A4R5ALS4_9ACTN|nr:hypothetical protein E1298_34985 [Actinomadura rubrisoli]
MGAQTRPMPMNAPVRPAVDEGDRLIVQRPALNMGSQAPWNDAAAPAGGTTGRSAGPRHARKAPNRASGHRRPVSLLVAAPAFITIAVVASTLLGAFGGESQHRKSGTPSSASTKVPPPQPGWYTVMPMADRRPSGKCLSIMADDRLKPQLAQDPCAADDRYQRIRLAAVPEAPQVFQIKAWTTQGRLWCAALDTRAERAALHMRDCGPDPLQRFSLEPTGKPVQAGQLFRLLPEATRKSGMCVGVDIGATGGVQTIHTACGRTGIEGYLFTPAPEP